MIDAGPGRCQEASLIAAPLPCNAKATRLIQHDWSLPGKVVLRMCAMCADHNVRNRGAIDVGPYVPDMRALAYETELRMRLKDKIVAARKGYAGYECLAVVTKSDEDFDFHRLDFNLDDLLEVWG